MDGKHIMHVESRRVTGDEEHTCFKCGVHCPPENRSELVMVHQRFERGYENYNRVCTAVLICLACSDAVMGSINKVISRGHADG